jgi:ATP-binding cassette subfamily C (CFTR/MRP) protein 1
LITILLDTVRIRTLWQIGEATTLCSIFVAGFAAKLALLVVESWSKRSFLMKKDGEVAGEELAGFLSKYLFLWLNPLLMKGFGNWLTPPDLSPIDSTLSSTTWQSCLKALLTRITVSSPRM